MIHLKKLSIVIEKYDHIDPFGEEDWDESDIDYGIFILRLWVGRGDAEPKLVIQKSNVEKYDDKYLINGPNGVKLKTVSDMDSFIVRIKERPYGINSKIILFQKELSESDNGVEELSKSFLRSIENRIITAKKKKQEYENIYEDEEEDEYLEEISWNEKLISNLNKLKKENIKEIIIEKMSELGDY